MSRGRWSAAVPAAGSAASRRRTRGRRDGARPAGGTPAFLLLLLVLFACRQKMANQPRYDPLEPSDFFADGMSARPRIAGTVARGELAITGFMATGKIDGAVADGFPFAVDANVMNRGEERYNIYCSVCHGKAGDGNGMIPARGYRRPPSLHTDILRAAKTGHFFDVMSRGFGAMPSYAAQVPVEDRWAIVAYIRALQLSQHATIADVPPDMKIDGETR
ncbi:MAG: cytochrome c [Acidobacteriota bacterium]